MRLRVKHRQFCHVTVWLFLSLLANGCALVNSKPADIRAQSVQDSEPQNSSDVVPEEAKEQKEQVAYVALTLRDTIEAALDHSEIFRVLDGQVDLTSSSVFDEMIARYEVGAEAGAFYPSLDVSFDGREIKEPPNAFFGPGIAARTQRDEIDFRARLTQPLQTGGEVSMGIDPPSAYLYFPDGVDPGEFNPSWSAEYVFQFRQPLLRGAGTQIATAPIQIADLQADQSSWQIQTALNSLIRSVSEAYWNLYATNIELQAIRGVIPLAEESVRIEQLRFDAEQIIYADLARAQFQLEGFRRDEALTLAEVRRRVLQLRQLIGGPATVEPILLAADIPDQVPPEDDGFDLAETAVQQRPSLNALRDLVQQRMVELNVSDNATRPQLDLRTEYRQSGLNERLDSAFRQAAGGHFSDWTVGFGLEVPIGNKTARSRQQIAELQLSRERIRLRETEQNVRFELLELHSDLQAAWQTYQITHRQAVQTQAWLRLSRIRYSEPPASSSGRNWMLLELADFQTAMRSYIDSVSASGLAIAQYNIQLAEIAEAQGTSMQRFNVAIDESSGESESESPAIDPLSGDFLKGTDLPVPTEPDVKIPQQADPNVIDISLRSSQAPTAQRGVPSQVQSRQRVRQRTPNSDPRLTGRHFGHAFLQGEVPLQTHHPISRDAHPGGHALP